MPRTLVGSTAMNVNITTFVFFPLSFAFGLKYLTFHLFGLLFLFATALKHIKTCDGYCFSPDQQVKMSSPRGLNGLSEMWLMWKGGQKRENRDAGNPILNTLTKAVSAIFSASKRPTSISLQL